MFSHLGAVFNMLWRSHKTMNESKTVRLVQFRKAKKQTASRKKSASTKCAVAKKEPQTINSFISSHLAITRLYLNVKIIYIWSVL